MPHFETVEGRQILFVEGRPFTVLAVEIPWWDLIDGRHAETLQAYDHLYPAARAMGLNALKVPIKWSMVEPEKGVFDFAYVDHAKAMAEKHDLKLVLNWFGHYASGDGNIYRNLTGELYVPLDIVRDEKTYPRAVDADGVAHHNAISYDDDAVIEREVAAFGAFMEHIRKIDVRTRTILMIQVENEIAVFGADRQNRKLWRDHSPASDKAFAEKGFTEDLKYSAWRLSSNWIRRITDAGGEIYPVPFFLNYVGGKLADWMVGGAPGEDVATYLENCPRIAFIGLNLYVPPESSVNDFRAALARYRVSRNLASITETNSDRGPVAPRLAYVAVGEFGAPIFAPWALNVSYPIPFQPYVLSDGALAHGAAALRDTYNSLRAALPQVTYYARTDKLKVFMSRLPGQKFSETQDVNGAKVVVSGEDNGQAIVIHPAQNEYLIMGFRCEVSLWSPMFGWPDLEKVRVERGRFNGVDWKAEGPAAEYGVNPTQKALFVYLDAAQVVRVHW
ncbi:MAG: hypothetical protein HYS61_04870 [Acidobacteria bacterium]|nr:hypothetical protein [Acidobacteriota bacterium]